MSVAPRRQDDDTIESFLDHALDRISLRQNFTEDLRDELRAHLLEAMESGRSCEEALQDFGDPAEAAKGFQLVAAELPVSSDPIAFGAILAVAAGWILLFVPLTIAPAVYWGLSGGSTEILRSLCGIGQIARAMVAAIAGVAAYRLSMRWRGNPRRVVPFIALSALLFAGSVLTRFDLFVARPLPAPRWNAFFIADLPGLGSYALDLDRSGIPAACRIPVPWSRIDLPLRALHLRAGLLALDAVAVGTARTILRLREDASHV